EVFEYRAHLHVSKLSDIEMTAAGSASPAEEEIAGRLYQALADHNSLAVIPMMALAKIGFQNGCIRFLDLQEDRIVIGSHEQGYRTLSSHTSHADDLQGQVTEPIAVKQSSYVFW